MKMRLPRLFAAGLALALLAVPLTVQPAPAAAATPSTVVPYIPPGGHSALTILPSVVVPAGRAAASSPEALLLVLSRFIKSPEALSAYRAMKAGTATPAQTTLVVAQKAAYAVPATVPKVLTKIPPGGGLGVAFGGFQVGTMLGAGASRMLGFKDEQVCAEQNKVLTVFASLLDGVSCGSWNSALTKAQQNLDMSPTLRSGVAACDSSGRCITYLGFRVLGPTYGVACFHTPGDTVANFVFVGSVQDGATVGSGAATYCRASYGNSASTDRQTAASGGNSLQTPTRFGLGSPLAPSAEYVVQASDISRANPPRTLKAKIRMTNGSTVAGPSSDQFTETDPVFKMAPLPVIAPDMVPDQVTIVESSPGLPDSDLMVQPTTPEYQKYRVDYPQCQDGACILDLVKNGAGTCLALGTQCADWFTNPNKSTEYQCLFGANPVVLSECNSYAPKFKPGNLEQGTTLGDPTTGETVGVKTETGLETPNSLGTPVKDPEKSRACFPSGWGIFNPVSWVLEPIKCATEWAAIPRPSKVAAYKDAVGAKYHASALGTATTVLAPLAAFNVSSGGCGGLPLRIHFAPWGLDWTGHLFAACDEPMAGVAATVKALGNWVLLAAGAFAMLRYIAGIVGYAGYGTGSSGASASGVEFSPADDSGWNEVEPQYGASRQWTL